MFSDNTLKHFQFLEREDYIKIWRRKDGQPHRIGAPAIISPRHQHEEWIVNGEYHRTDGPAVQGVNVNGPYQWWWVNNVRMTRWIHFQTASGCSNEEILLLKLKYGDLGFEA